MLEWVTLINVSFKYTLFNEVINNAEKPRVSL